MPKRVAIVGYGLGGARFHAPLIAATEGLELTAIVTSDATRAADASERYPGSEVLGSVELLAARAPELDAVVVAAPNRNHVEVARRFVKLGVPVVTSFQVVRVMALLISGGALYRVLAQRYGWPHDVATPVHTEQPGDEDD